MTGKELLDWFMRRQKPSLEEMAKRLARQKAIERYAVDSRKHAQLVTQLVNVPRPVFQNYLDDPNYVWNPSVIPVPPKPRPI
jgi:exopolysaccharide biosynthesis predicted pyruvyltransferase EpsI